MPFQSEKQRRYLWANEPEIARDWTDTYGSGIAKALGGRIGFQEGKGTGWAAQQILNKKQQELKNLQILKAQQESMGIDTTGIDKGIQSIENFIEGHVEEHNLDPVQESRISPEQRAGIREMMAARSGNYSGLGPHRGMPLSAEDRQAYLAELLENDPASSLYDLSTVKDFSEEENPFRKDRMSRGVEGYYSDGTAYVKDLDKLGTQVGLFKGGEFDKQLASVASHELTHPKVSKYGIDMSNIEEPRELPTDGYLHDKTYMPHEKEELLTRMIEMQNFPEEANAEWYFGESPYAISKHPSGAEGYEAGKILQSSLEPALQKYNQLIESEKNPLIYDEETGYDARDLQERGLASKRSGLASIGPHGWEYGNQWQKPEQQKGGNWLRNIADFLPFVGKNTRTGAALRMLRNQFMPEGGIRSMFNRPTTSQQQATQRFMQNYNVGRNPQTGRMIGGPFAGRNLPGTSMFGSKTPQEMAQKWMSKYGSRQYNTEKMMAKQKEIRDLAAGNTNLPPSDRTITPTVPKTTYVNPGKPHGNGGNRAAGTGTTQTGHGKSGMGRDPSDRMARGGLAALWQR